MAHNQEETKIRKNITITPSLWEILRTIGKVLGKSASSLIEESIKAYLKKENINMAYMKMMAASYLDKDENAEISQALDQLTEEDLDEGEELDV
jgi:hypothetical protein